MPAYIDDPKRDNYSTRRNRGSYEVKSGEDSSATEFRIFRIILYALNISENNKIYSHTHMYAIIYIIKFTIFVIKDKCCIS